MSIPLIDSSVDSDSNPNIGAIDDANARGMGGGGGIVYQFQY